MSLRVECEAARLSFGYVPPRVTEALHHIPSKKLDEATISLPKLVANFRFCETSGKRLDMVL